MSTATPPSSPAGIGVREDYRPQTRRGADVVAADRREVKAEGVLYFVSESGGYTTGAMLEIDGCVRARFPPTPPVPRNSEVE